MIIASMQHPHDPGRGLGPIGIPMGGPPSGFDAFMSTFGPPPPHGHRALGGSGGGIHGFLRSLLMHGSDDEGDEDEDDPDYFPGSEDLDSAMFGPPFSPPPSSSRGGLGLGGFPSTSPRRHGLAAAIRLLSGVPPPPPPGQRSYASNDHVSGRR